MQISLRSHLIAGTAAVVGASAIALTPVIAQHEALPNIQVPAASAEVALAGLDSPISELFKTLGQINELTFSNATSLNPFLGKVGVVPQIINDSLPIVSQLGVNGSAYLLNSLNGAAQAGYALSEGVWNAAGDLLSLDPVGAVQTLLASVQAAGGAALAAGQFVLNGVLSRVTALTNFVVAAVPGLLPVLQAQVQEVVATFTDVFGGIATAIGSQDWEGAFNTFSKGFFGPVGEGGTRSFPGTALNLTVGQGALSLRTEVSALVKGVANALNTPPLAPVIPPPTAAVKSVASSAAAARKAVAPSVAAVDSDNGGSTAGDNDGGSKSAAKSSSNGGSDRGSAKNSKH